VFGNGTKYDDFSILSYILCDCRTVTLKYIDQVLFGQRQ